MNGQKNKMQSFNKIRPIRNSKKSKYRKIPIISAGLILFRKPFLGGLFSGGGGYYRGGGLIIGMIFVSRICLIKFLRIMFIGQVHGLVIPLSVNWNLRTPRAQEGMQLRLYKQMEASSDMFMSLLLEDLHHWSEVGK